MPVLTGNTSRLQYEIYGSGPPLLLLAGLAFGPWCWFKQIPTFARHFQVITIDSRDVQSSANPAAYSVAGFAADAAALLERLGIERAHVLGTSFGGFVAQELALGRPSLVDRLVLVCTSYGGRKSSTMSWQTMAAMLGWGADDHFDAARRGLEAATSPTYREACGEEFAQLVRWRLSDSPSRTSYWAQMLAGARFDAHGRVRGITAPALILHGSEDRVVPVSNAVALSREIPRARLRILDGAGHLVFLDGAGHLVFIERAEEVNEEILRFLEGRPSRHRAEAPTKRRPWWRQW